MCYMGYSDDVGTATDLARYRLAKAKSDLHEANQLIGNGSFSGANNRIYYAIFHAMLAMHALDRRETRTHKRVIGEFNRYYIRTGIFPTEYGKKISHIENTRHSSDYDDFYIANAEETKQNFIFAEEFLVALENQCKKRMEMD